MTIGDLARETGVHVETIRYYEREGLLPRPARSPSGQRRYREADVRRLAFLKRCRDLGFPLADARMLASLAEAADTTCADVKEVLAKHLRDVRAKLADLQALERALTAMEQICPGSVSPDCPILAELQQGQSTSRP
ncbi:MAG: helix-turn-helix domain-containing protein [Rhodospirillales bacterium]|nr:helix-turn-helix domain-containing protein [Rhodospirillales bacterium]